MKKALFAALMLCSSLMTVHAQLKVSSTGNVTVDGYLNAHQFQPTTYSGWSQMTTTFPALTVVDQLTPVSYRKTGQQNPGIPTPNNLRYSIPGSNLNTYMPDLVVNGGLAGYLVNYDELVPMLVQAVKELKSHIVILNTMLGINDEEESEFAEEQEQPNNSLQQFMSRTSLSDRFAGAVLYQNRPNPFSAQTVIRFRLPDDAQEAFIYIFDMTGKTVKQVALEDSQESITINGYELSPGMYLYSLVVNGQEISTKRMILSKQ